LGNIGICYQNLHDISTALDLHQRALEVDEQLGNLAGQARHLGNIGICHQTLGETSMAKKYLARALELYEKMGIPDGHPDVALLRRSLHDNT
jgi:tetratricopeptide (TPR) repeat protein